MCHTASLFGAHCFIAVSPLAWTQFVTVNARQGRAPFFAHFAPKELCAWRGNKKTLARSVCFWCVMPSVVSRIQAMIWREHQCFLQQLKQKARRYTQFSVSISSLGWWLNRYFYVCALRCQIKANKLSLKV
jgi:hypothetical protein